MAGKSKAERISRWRTLLAYEQELRAELPSLKRDFADLRAMEEEATALFSQIARLQGQMREAVNGLRDVTRSGDLLRTRMGSSLRGQLGFENALLIKYGFEPRAKRGGFRHTKPRTRSRSKRSPTNGEIPS